MADLNVRFFGPLMQFSITFTSSVSMMLQHWPSDVTGFRYLLDVIMVAVRNGADGTAYDSQYPRHAFVFIENSTQSEISIFLLCPSHNEIRTTRKIERAR